MFAQFSFIHTSGLVIWQSAEQPSTHPVDQLLTLLYVEKRAISSPYAVDEYNLYHLYVKELSMFTIAVSQRGLTIPGVKDIVLALTHLFIKEYEANIRVLPLEYSRSSYASFDAFYDANLRSLVSTGKTLEQRGVKLEPDAQSQPKAPDDAPDDVPVVEEMPVDLTDVKKRIKEMARERQGNLRASMTLSATNATKSKPQNSKKQKTSDKTAEDFLQYSHVEERPVLNSNSAVNSASEPDTKTAPVSTPISKGLSSSQADDTIFGPFLGKKELGSSDLEKIMVSIRQSLINKNVASEVADELLKGLKINLEGEKVGLFSRVKPMVIKTLKDSIANIIQFKSNSFMQEILNAKSERAAGNRSRPYVICMTGVNGVGKTTSIAKLLYIFQNNGLRSMVCACDSFRSGAVEQLQVHCERLGAMLYSQGYGKNASSIAKYGIKEAEKLDCDVCLIDTTGRQYNNGPLMQALGALVLENTPDIVIFVGEALTGNEGIEQLRQFDKALKSYTNSRGIDGIILTKVDTCSEKIGAAINLCFICNIPIIYVGTGQSYPDFSTLDPAYIADMIVGK